MKLRKHRRDIQANHKFDAFKEGEECRFKKPSKFRNSSREDHLAKTKRIQLKRIFSNAKNVKISVLQKGVHQQN